MPSEPVLMVDCRPAIARMRRRSVARASCTAGAPAVGGVFGTATGAGGGGGGRDGIHIMLSATSYCRRPVARHEAVSVCRLGCPRDLPQQPRLALPVDRLKLAAAVPFAAHLQKCTSSIPPFQLTSASFGRSFLCGRLAFRGVGIGFCFPGFHFDFRHMVFLSQYSK